MTIPAYTPIEGLVPNGGTTGQLLAKRNSADQNTEWVDPAEGGEGGATITADAGQVLVGDGSGNGAGDANLKWLSNALYLPQIYGVSGQVDIFADGDEQTRIVINGSGASVFIKSDSGQSVLMDSTGIEFDLDSFGWKFDRTAGALINTLSAHLNVGAVANRVGTVFAATLDAGTSVVTPLVTADVQLNIASGSGAIEIDAGGDVVITAGSGSLVALASDTEVDFSVGSVTVAFNGSALIANATTNTIDFGLSSAVWRYGYFGVVSTLPTVVASLPAAATAGAGARAFVTDALLPAFGAAVADGGAVSVPVYSDGAAWMVG